MFLPPWWECVKALAMVMWNGYLIFSSCFSLVCVGFSWFLWNVLSSHWWECVKALVMVMCNGYLIAVGVIATATQCNVGNLKYMKK